MLLSSGLGNGKDFMPAARRRKQTIRHRQARFRPQLEGLEARRLFSTLTVTNTHDSGAGSLRAQIAAAHNGDTIVFSTTMTPGTITLASGELALTRNLTIQGPGAAQLTVNANDASRVFEVAQGATVTLSGLTITRGWGAANGGYGGGILNNGTLSVVNSTVTNNGAIYGAGICNLGGTLTVSNSTLSANYATGLSGGGIYNAGGGLVTVSNSTFSNNQARDGGGIYNTGGTLTLTNHTTLSENLALPDYSGLGGRGGGIYNTGAGSVTISNSIVFSNHAGAFGLYGGGGGIYNNAGSTATVRNFSSITANTGSFEGAPEDANNLGVLYRDDTSTIGVLIGNAAIRIHGKLADRPDLS
jgi:predicted outer membrane repeat protein